MRPHVPPFIYSFDGRLSPPPPRPPFDRHTLAGLIKVALWYIVIRGRWTGRRVASGRLQRADRVRRSVNPLRPRAKRPYSKSSVLICVTLVYRWKSAWKSAWCGRWSNPRLAVGRGQGMRQFIANSTGVLPDRISCFRIARRITWQQARGVRGSRRRISENLRKRRDWVKRTRLGSVVNDQN